MFQQLCREKVAIILCHFLWPQKENIIYRNKHCASVPRACDCPPVIRALYQRLKSAVARQREMVGGISGGGGGAAVVLPPRSHENMSKAMARM